MIVPTLMRLIIREHLHKPIRGKVLTLGRQTISGTHKQVLSIMQQEGCTIDEISPEELELAYDQNTRSGKETGFIDDKTFFKLLGINDVLTMDVSSYENADIIHDLNVPIPESLYDQFDFIIDGGTFDHLFDVREAFENVVRLLRPGGRIFQWNAASNFTGAAYISFGPDLFYDYYVLNQFADCKVYIAEVDRISQGELWDLYEFKGRDTYAHLRSNRIQMVVVLAEKGPSSTWDKIPIQAQYRDAHLWQPYRTAQKMISLSGRQSWTGSVGRLGRRGTSVKNSIHELISKMREKGIAWCFKRSFIRAIQYLLRCCWSIYNPIKRRSRMVEGEKPKGYKYVGKI